MAAAAEQFKESLQESLQLEFLPPDQRLIVWDVVKAERDGKSC